MIRLVVFAGASLGRACLCSRLRGRDDVRLLAVGDALEDLVMQVGDTPVDAVLVVRAGGDAAGLQSMARLREYWPEAEWVWGCSDRAADGEPGVDCLGVAAGGRRVRLSGSVASLVRQIAGPADGSYAAPSGPFGGSRGPQDALTRRELEVLRHLALGHSARESAGFLGLSSRTVDGLRRQVSDKLGCVGAAKLTRLAIGSGLIEAGAGLPPSVGRSRDRRVAARCV